MPSLWRLLISGRFGIGVLRQTAEGFEAMRDAVEGERLFCEF